ncbi:3'(2'),5'-bisphosphate nucleotidase CysQ [Salidesulfovibrio brasiliensis]|uniref:3'(2'),5'-bisphosphate nucleotidase CysQ n=1 Tax=Salidesulfovibrio brasiliensis TaxID=221711 RepID=UPI0006D173F8|nr:3'(2'),5'-bisphosphate nucleotidase CysQ [Salidesulfovibrio brasiliensis]
MTLAPADMIQDMIAIARDAGKAIMEIYQRDFEVMTKDDKSPLTEADLASHHTIIDRLKAGHPDIPVLSEESKAIPYEERMAWTRYFLIDPLDGTKEFVKRNGEFTVNIALIENGRPVAGAVYAPVPDVSWYAAEGFGAWKATADDEPVAIAAARLESLENLRVVGSRSHPSPAMQAVLDELPDHELLPMGSSIKLCAVADGSADFYPRLGPTCEWDTGAAQCVVEQAGGCVITLQGDSVSYNKEDILNPFFLVIASVDDDLRGRLGALAARHANEQR